MHGAIELAPSHLCVSFTLPDILFIDFKEPDFRHESSFFVDSLSYIKPTFEDSQLKEYIVVKFSTWYLNNPEQCLDRPWITDQLCLAANFENPRTSEKLCAILFKYLFHMMPIKEAHHMEHVLKCYCTQFSRCLWTFKIGCETM